MNLKVNKKAPLLQQGSYKARVTNYREIDSAKAVITVAINGNLYPIWLDESKEISYKDLTGQTVTTNQAQLTFDAIVTQLSSNPLLEQAENMDEIIAILLMETTVLDVWVTVFEERLNNFHFYKPKNFDATSVM